MPRPTEDLLAKAIGAARQIFANKPQMPADVMSPQDQEAYRQATGATISGQPPAAQPQPAAGPPQVAPRPAQKEQLLRLLMGRGLTRQQAEAMAAQHGL